MIGCCVGEGEGALRASALGAGVTAVDEVADEGVGAEAGFDDESDTTLLPQADESTEKMNTTHKRVLR